MTAEPQPGNRIMKIYVACLASYNAGILHGAWIDAESDVDAMQEEVNRILRESPCPNVTVTCPECEGEGKPYGFGDSVCEVCKGKGEVPSAEEYAIHDFDGLPSTFGEYCGLQTVADFVELTEDFDYIDSDDIAAIVADQGGDVSAARDMLNDSFCGIYDSFRDYADESAEEAIACHSDGKGSEFLARYFDYEAFARDLAFDMTTIDLPSGKVAVFYA